MSKIFSKNQGPAVDVKRNTFDLSFASHITGKIGDLIPVYCQEVIPGDSFEIDPTFGLRFNPTVFPIQTKMHGIMHFFYVRNRNLMDKWPEYIGRTDDDVVHPYLSINENNAKNIIGTGTIGDYLGVPTTLTGEYAKNLNVTLDTMLYAEPQTDEGVRGRRTSVVGRPNGTFDGTALSLVNRKAPSYMYLPSNLLDGTFETEFYFNPYIRNWYYGAENSSYDNPSWKKFYGYVSTVPVLHPINTNDITFSNPMNLGTTKLDLASGAYLVFFVGEDTNSTIDRAQPYAIMPINLHVAQTTGAASATMAASVRHSAQEVVDAINTKIGTQSVWCAVVLDPTVADAANFLTQPSTLPTASTFKCFGDSITFGADGIQVLDSTDPNTVTFNPFVTHAGESAPKIKLNALPFRAYESIYNYFYRDETVDPFVKGGKPVYNDFITTHSGGADSTSYSVYQKNWERDYYTSCQTSPQQGEAPLVGISASGTFTFDDGTNEYTAQMTIGDDGETITGISTYSPDMPKGSLRQLMDVVTNGVSINDLRNVNSLQRWLETNIRRGYKYVDQIYSHFGVNPAFKANDCPEFIGGIHVTGTVNQINNNTSEGLGDYAGQLSMFGGSNNKIHCYADEHGYIIGVMATFPEPCYSQMLPKYFTKTMTPLDYFFPEFGHIGMQPITYNEVCPLEVAASDNHYSEDTINDTFGYQRAWADYLANNDQVHGDFRTDMSSFVMSRVFNEKPELGHDFIAIDDNDVNDVFVTTDGSDKMLGELRFDIKAKRPIPMYGIPRIE